MPGNVHPEPLEDWPPRRIKQRWAIDGVDKPLPKLRAYVRMYTPESEIDWLYIVEWVDHIRHRVGLRRLT